MQELALFTFGGNVSAIRLPEGFTPCERDKSGRMDFTSYNKKCPFCYADKTGVNCFAVNKMKIGCPFITKNKTAQEYLTEKLNTQKCLGGK